MDRHCLVRVSPVVRLGCRIAETGQKPRSAGAFEGTQGPWARYSACSGFC